MTPGGIGDILIVGANQVIGPRAGVVTGPYRMVFVGGEGMKLAHRALNGLDGHTAGRQLLAELYRERTGQPLPQIRVTDRGKPYFADAQAHFSISHTKGHVFCVLADKPVGIDAEEADREIDLRLAEKILSPTEHLRYNRAADQRVALLKLWVLKEGYAKLTGRGWGSYLYETDFDPEDERIREIDGCFVAVIQNAKC